MTLGVFILYVIRIDLAHLFNGTAANKHRLSPQSTSESRSSHVFHEEEHVTVVLKKEQEYGKDKKNHLKQYETVVD